MKFNVVVNRTKTIESSYEYEGVSAKTEEEAQEKVEGYIAKAQEKDSLDKMDWGITSESDDFEYDVT